MSDSLDRGAVHSACSPVAPVGAGGSLIGAVVLHPSHDAAAFSKLQASSLGVRHMTPESLISSLWDVWGDARSIVSSRYRLLKVRSRLSAHGFQESLGTARVLSGFICRASAVLSAPGQSSGTGKGPHGDEPAGAFAASSFAAGSWQHRALALAKEYLSECEADGRIEIGEAARLMEPQLSRIDISISPDCLLDEPYASVLAGLVDATSLRDEGRAAPADSQRSPAMGICADSLSVLVSAGPQVQAARAANRALELLRADEDCSVAIYTDEAARVLDALFSSGFSFANGVAVMESVPVGSTLVGQAVWNACRIWRTASSSASLSGAFDALAAAVDLAASPYLEIGSFDASGLPSQGWRERPHLADASCLDALWRSDRTLGAVDFMRDLKAVSKTFESMLAAFDACSSNASNGERLTLLAISELKSVAHALFEHRPSEISACNRIGDDLMAALAIGLPIEEALEASMASSVPSKRIVQSPVGSSPVAGRMPSVVVSSLHSGTSFGAAAFDHAIISDVSDAAFSFKNAPDPIVDLEEALGLAVHASASQRSQVDFDSAARSAGTTLTCMMSLHDADSKESFPSPCFERMCQRLFGADCPSASEIVSCSSASELEMAPCASGVVLSEVSHCGEDDVIASVGASLRRACSVESLEAPVRGKLRACTVLPRLPHAEVAGAFMPVMSPSAMEAYLSCPYRWFIERIVSPETLDEGFGPLETGNFAHLVLKDFYSRFFEVSGHRRPRNEDAELVESVLDDVFASAIEAQREMKPCSGRYIPIGHIDLLATQALRASILESVMCQMSLPPSLEPCFMELPIGEGHRDCGADAGSDAASAQEPILGDGKMVAYAGFALRGRIDRVDAVLREEVTVADASVDEPPVADAVSPSDIERFCIIDYKGSVKSHEAGSEAVREGGLPHYVQALIYAQALRRLLGDGAECVGALYTSYRARLDATLAVGSWSSGFAGLSEASDSKSRVDIGFEEFLDLIEESCAERLAGVMESKIPNEPSCSDSCAYCPFGKGGRCSL